MYERTNRRTGMTLQTALEAVTVAQMLEPWADLSMDETDGLALVFVAAVQDVAGLGAVGQFERTAMKWLRRYLDEKEPTLTNFAKVVPSLTLSP
jgi:hypothetical protein